jgi:NADPH:quinone reductase-like Zn-dependent oxidoreductase
MFAVTASQTDPDNPLKGLTLGERPDPAVPDGWTTVSVRAAALNHHDLWTLKGVGISQERLPIVLGCDAAGVDEDGREVIVHAVIGTPVHGDETLDPKRSLLSEIYDGAFAEKVAVPRGNLVPKPAGLSFEDAACLPTAWLTAYRMLFEKAEVQPGATVLVQGAGGGVATALIALGRAGGLRMWATSRSADKRERALGLGADRVFESGARLPERVDAVMETVGPATWDHSLSAVRPGGRVVICGATSGLGRADQAGPGVLPAEVDHRVDDGDPGAAGPAGRLPAADRHPPGDRPGAAAGAGRGGLRRDACGGSVRQSGVHRINRDI